MFVLKLKVILSVTFHETLMTEVIMHAPNLHYASLKKLELIKAFGITDKSNIYTSASLALF